MIHGALNGNQADLASLGYCAALVGCWLWNRRGHRRFGMRRRTKVRR